MRPKYAQFPPAHGLVDKFTVTTQCATSMLAKRAKNSMTQAQKLTLQPTICPTIATRFKYTRTHQKRFTGVKNEGPSGKDKPIDVRTYDFVERARSMYSNRPDTMQSTKLNDERPSPFNEILRPFVD